MSSTDDARLGRFFDRRLVPTAERLRARGVRFLPMGPEAASESWYVRPAQGEPEFEELDGPEACEVALRELWRRQGLPELEALAGPLLELARKLEVREEAAGEISPFVYVMY